MRGLVIRLSSLGDLVLLTASFDALASKGVEINLLTKSLYQPLFSEDKRVSKVYTIRGSGISDIMNAIKSLRKEKFDVIFDMHRKIPTFLIRHFLSGKKYLWKAHFLKRRFGVLTKNFSIEHTYKRFLYPIVKVFPELELEVEASSFRPNLFVSEKMRNYSLNFLNSINCGKTKKIGISPGAKHNTKKWVHYGFAKVSSHLVKDGFSVFLFGDISNSDVETSRVIEEYVKENTSGENRIINLCGKLSLDKFVSLVSCMDAFISNDSGALHVSSALSIPTVGIFCSTRPDMGFSPIGQRVEVIENRDDELRCRPCSLHGLERCPKEHFLCSKGIREETVLNALYKIIQ